MQPYVLFDLDGTITNPEIGITGSFRYALDSVGFPYDDDADLGWIIGPPIRDNLATVGLPAHLHQQVIDTYRARHLDVGLYEVELIPGMTSLLADLVQQGQRLALATAKPLVQAQLTLDHLGIAQHFEVVAGARLDGVASTKADIVADALRQLDATGDRATMVGDRLHDINGGRANGCRSIAVTWGFAEPGELEACSPDQIVTTTEELAAVLADG